MKKIKGFFAKFKDAKFRKIFFSILAVVLLLVGAFTFEKKVDRVSVDDSLIDAPMVSVAPVIPGDLKKVYIYEGENIRRGDPIADVGNQTIHAQSDGLVVKVNSGLGGIVSAQTPVAQLIDPNQLRVDGTIDETKGLKDIKVGQPVSFTVDAFPGRTFWGFVDEVSPTSKSTQLSFSVSSERPVQQFEVFARFDSQTYPEIKNGMSAKMTVFTHSN